MGRDRDRSRDRDRDRDRGRDRERSRDRERDKDRDIKDTKEKDHRKRDKSRSKDRKERKRRHSPSSSSPSSSSISSSDTEHRSSSSRKHKKKSSKSSKKRKHRKRSSSTSSSTSNTTINSSREHRKLAKKQLKAELSAQKQALFAAQLSTSLGYNDKDNPFHDTNLSSKFVWAKKREQEIKSSSKLKKSRQEVLEEEKRRHEEVQESLRKLNERRQERERDKELREAEDLRLQREQESAMMGDWEKKENEFQLEQSKRRAQIRVKEGRARPVDILAINISLATDSELATEFEELGLEMSAEEPYLIFQDLPQQEMEALHQDIQMYLRLEENEAAKEFWKYMLIVADAQLSTFRPAPRTGVSDQVLKDITSLLSSKTHLQLESLEAQVKLKLGSTVPIDTEYWETLLRELIVWKARAKLKQLHRDMLLKRLTKLREKHQQEQQEDVSQDMDRELESLKTELIEKRREQGLDDSMGLAIANESDAAGSGSGVRRSGGVGITEVSRETLESLGIRIEDGFGRRGEKGEEEDDEDDGIFQKTDDAVFTDEVANEDASKYLWSDKYRPRKPQYYNRVITGYEWNKYNRTHYDPDNPPPKTVQGYKFNVFYPDLIDKTKAPTYKIVRDEGYPDTVLLKFVAGPPYEDVAFRIVNREWEHSHRKGFRSSFDKGVLQLHFHFKRQYYRR